MEPEDLAHTDPNTLPYYIIQAQAARRIPVRFEPLTPQDAPELQNEDWANAVFASAWRQYINVERVLKLVCVASADQRIQGLVHVGSVEPGAAYLKKSLLEAAPFNQHDTDVQTYRGVGRVLIARLVVESVLQGAQGRVLVRPRTGTARFYETIGFEAVQPLKRNYALNEAQAATLLAAACFP